MASSVRQPNPQPNTQSAKEKHGVLRSIIKHIANLKNSFLHKCGIYIDLLKLYTPFGKVLAKFRGPKSLEQWNPSKHITPGFLSKTMPLPNPNKLSFKTRKISRITTWCSSNLLQVGQLALTQKNDKLERKLNLLRSAIASKDQISICHAAKNVAALLISPSILNQIPSQTGKEAYIEYMKSFSHMFSSIEIMRDLDKEVHNLSALNENKKMPEYKLPGNHAEFLDTAIKRAIPEMNRAQMTPNDIEAAICAANLKRTGVECALHWLCRKLEPTQPNASDYTKKVTSTMDQLEKKMPKEFSNIDHETPLLLNVLRDNVLHHTPSHASPLMQLIIKETSQLFKEATPTAQDDAFLSQKPQVYNLLHTRPELHTQLVDHLNNRLALAVQKVEQHMISALSAQGIKDPSAIISTLTEDLIQKNKISTTDIKTFLSLSLEDDALQAYISSRTYAEKSRDDIEPEQAQSIEDLLALSKKLISSTEPSINKIQLTEYKPDSLSAKIKIPYPKDFESASTIAADLSALRPHNQQLIVQELNNILEQIPPDHSSVSSLAPLIKEYQKATLPTSADTLSDIVEYFREEVFPNIASEENLLHITIRLKQLLTLEIIEAEMFKGAQRLQSMPQDPETPITILTAPTKPLAFWNLAEQVTESMFKQEIQQHSMQHQKLKIHKELALGQCMIRLLYNTMESGTESLDALRKTPEGQQIEQAGIALSRPLQPVYTHGEQVHDMLSAMKKLIHKKSPKNSFLVKFIVRLFPTICPNVPLNNILDQNSNELGRLKKIKQLITINPSLLPQCVDYVNHAKNSMLDEVNKQTLNIMSQQGLNKQQTQFTIDFANRINNENFSETDIKDAFKAELPDEKEESLSPKELLQDNPTSLFDTMKDMLTEGF